MIQTIAVIGLGSMGGAMALTLARAGFTVQGYDCLATARERMTGKGLETASTIPALAPADLYLLSLPTSAHVRDALEGDSGVVRQARSGALIIDTSTSDPAATRALAPWVESNGLDWLDAPVSGGPAGAASGRLGMLIGGRPEVLERAAPVIDALSVRHTHVGGAGSGHVTKLVNNLLCATHLVTTAEALALAGRAGVDIDACLAGINSGSGRSAVSEVNFPQWVRTDRFDSGFTMGLMRKDVRLAEALAGATGLTMPVLGSVARTWEEAQSLDDSEDFNRIAALILGEHRI